MESNRSFVMAEAIGDTVVGRLAVERKLMTLPEVTSCQAEQKRLLKEEGKRLPLSEIALRLGYVTRSQLQRLSGDAEDSIATRAQQIPGFQILEKLGAGA